MGALDTRASVWIPWPAHGCPGQRVDALANTWVPWPARGYPDQHVSRERLLELAVCTVSQVWASVTPPKPGDDGTAGPGMGVAMLMAEGSAPFLVERKCSVPLYSQQELSWQCAGVRDVGEAGEGILLGDTEDMGPIFLLLAGKL